MASSSDGCHGNRAATSPGPVARARVVAAPTSLGSLLGAGHSRQSARDPPGPRNAAAGNLSPNSHGCTKVSALGCSLQTFQ